MIKPEKGVRHTPPYRGALFNVSHIVKEKNVKFCYKNKGNEWLKWNGMIYQK